MNRALKGWRRYTLVGPPLMIYSLGQSLAGNAMVLMMWDRKFMNMNGTSMNQSMEFEDNYRHMQMYKQLIDYLIPIILLLFLGPWSDKYGRKPLMIVGCAASAISFSYWGTISYMILDHWWYLMASVPQALAGGSPLFTVITYCYISDLTSDHERAWHFTWQQSIAHVAIIIGSLLYHEIFGFTIAFEAASVCSFIAMIYIAILVPETVIRDSAQRSWRNSFDVKLIKGIIETCAMKRNDIDRIIVWCCILCLAIFMLVNRAEQGIMYWFITQRANFLPWMNLYHIIVSILAIICPLFIVKIGQMIVDKNMADIIIALFAIIPLTMGSVGKSFSTEPWLFYLSAGLSIFDRVSAPILWAVLSKSVSSRDTGKVFGLAMSVKTALSLASVPLYSMINDHTRLYYPAPGFLISAGFYTMAIALVGLIGWRMRGKIRATVANESDGAILRMITPSPDGEILSSTIERHC